MIAIAIVLLSQSAAATPYLAIGRVDEGAGLEGQGAALGRAVGHALESVGSFRLVAGSRAKNAAVKKILEINRRATRDDQWIEVGKAVGATHLLTGEVRRSGDVCTAFVEIVELVSQEAKTTRPEVYDCTVIGAAGLADELCAQLTGKKPAVAGGGASLGPPIDIRVTGEEGDLNGKKIVYDGESGDWRPGTKPKVEPPKPAVEPEPPKPEPPKPEPPKPEAWPSTPLVEPRPPPEPPKEHSAFALAREVYANRSIVAGLLLALPIFFTLLAFPLKWAARGLAARWLSLGIGACLAATILEAGALLYYQRLEHSVLAELDLASISAAPIAFVMSVVGASWVVTLGEIGVLHRIRFALLTGIVVVGAVYLIVSDQPPVLLLAGLAVAFVAIFGFGRRRARGGRGSLPGS